MITNLAAIKYEAWTLVNKARKAVGLRPVLFFPASIRNSEDQCVIASTIPPRPDRDQRKIIAEAWGTEVYSAESEIPPSNEDYYLTYQGDWIKLPAKVTEFRNLFNAGHYPELEQERTYLKVI